MKQSIIPAFRDFLVRFQQNALKETGRRPMTYLRSSMEQSLILPGCLRSGYVFWQPMPWQNVNIPLGQNKGMFHESIIDYYSMCQFLEVRFRLPVAHQNSPLSFLYRRVFELYSNTQANPPMRALDEAIFLYEREATKVLSVPIACTCDGGEMLQIMVCAENGKVMIQPSNGEAVLLSITLDKIFPKAQFVYDI